MIAWPLSLACVPWEQEVLAKYSVTYSGSLGYPVVGKGTMTLTPYFESDFSMTCVVFVTESVDPQMPSGDMIAVEGCPSDCPKYKLGDPEWSTPADIDIIVSIQAFAKICKTKIVDLGANLKLMQTHLGYACFGEAYKDAYSINSARLQRAPEMNDLDRFFEYELDDEEKDDFPEVFYKATVMQDENGFTEKNEEFVYGCITPRKYLTRQAIRTHPSTSERVLITISISLLQNATKTLQMAFPNTSSANQ